MILCCVARDEVKAVRVLDELKGAGVDDERISVLLPENAVAGGFEPANQAERLGMFGGAEGRAGLLCGALKPLVDIGALTRPGLGRMMGAGPLVAALNAPSAGPDAHGFTGELVRAGIPPEPARTYELCLREGKVLLSVECDGAQEAARVELVLKQAGAQELARCPQAATHAHC